MEFDTKIKIALRDDLKIWQKLNVTAFLMSGIAGTQNIVGQPYVDQDDVHYLPMSQQPIMIHTASGAQLKDILQKALTKEIVIAIFTEELFGTYNDEDNRAMVANDRTQDLNLVGIAMRGNKNQVDRLFKGIALLG